MTPAGKKSKQLQDKEENPLEHHSSASQTRIPGTLYRQGKKRRKLTEPIPPGTMTKKPATYCTRVRGDKATKGWKI